MREEAQRVIAIDAVQLGCGEAAAPEARRELCPIAPRSKGSVLHPLDCGCCGDGLR
jgi:hypothetical protein